MTLAEASNFLSIAKTAYAEALKSKSYSMSMDGVNRSNQKQDLKALLDAVNYWEKEVSRITAGRTGLDVRYGTPVI